MPVLTSAVNDTFHSLQKRASEGVFQGGKPNEVNTSDPLALFVIQASIIIIFTRAIGYVLKKLRQPKVVAEVIGGIILGPSILGHIPNYMDLIFPHDSLTYLNLVSTIGLILFLFMIGMEIDIRSMKKYALSSLAISISTLIIPLGVGIAVGIAIWNEFNDNDDAIFSHYILFIGIAIAITAFPVLCRILVEYKLTDTPVGIVVLFAGVINDVIGWILLALIVALVNSGGDLTTLWILLVVLGWTLLLIFVIRPAFMFIAKRTGSLDGAGPTQFVMMLALLLLFISSFVTDIIGVHPIFGAFLVGVIMPKEGNFTIIVTEKIEDLTSIIFLPIYFGLTGLQTDLSLLNTGIIWGYIVLVITVAFLSKFLTGAVTAKLCSFNVRESAAIGTLMSCKGLVEIIVLNVGLQTNIIDRRVFSLMIFMAVITTLMTTPLALWAYPSKYRKSAAVSQRIDKEKEGILSPSGESKDEIKKYLVVMQKMEHVPTLLHFTKFLEAKTILDSKEDEANATNEHSKTQVNALRLLELTERPSDSMKSELNELKSDPVLGIFNTFVKLRNFVIKPFLSLTMQDNFVDTVTEYTEEIAPDMVVLPWRNSKEDIEKDQNNQNASNVNPFDTLFAFQSGSQRYTHFIRRVLGQSRVPVAVYLDRGFGFNNEVGWNGSTVFLPFFGGPDDRIALRLVSQFCSRRDVNAIIVKINQIPINTTKSNEDSQNNDSHQSYLTQYSTNALPDTIYPHQSTQQQLASDTADDLIWTECQRNASTLDIQLQEINTTQPLADIIKIASDIKTNNIKPLLITVGRGRQQNKHTHQAELTEILTKHGINPNQQPVTPGHAAGRFNHLFQVSAPPSPAINSGRHIGSDERKTIGDIATAIVVSLQNNIIVVQSNNNKD